MTARPFQRLAHLTAAVLVTACAEPEPPATALPFPTDPPVLTAADLRADSADYIAVLRAEDRRAPTSTDLDRLVESLDSPEEGVARAAVRALGRLERPALAERIAGVLGDPAVAVATRAEAANALAQAVRGADGASRGAAVELLLAQLSGDVDATVGATVARSLGRIPPRDAEQAAEVAAALSARAEIVSDDDALSRLGLARAAFFHVRVTQRGYGGYDASALMPVVAGLLTDDDPTIRRTAAATRRALPQPATAAERALLTDDPDAGVRREGMLWAGARSPEPAEPWRLEWLREGLDDPAAEVRLAAVQGWAARAPESERCGPLVSAASGVRDLDDPGDAVSLAAISALGAQCGDDATAAQAAAGAIVASLGDDPSSWHRPAAALISLVALAPDGAAAALPDFVVHENPFVRTAAAVAAARLDAQDVLRRLSVDPDANVREAALLGWGEEVPDEVLLAQLERREPQILRAVASVLETRAHPDLAPRLFDALDAVSDPVRATMRDARVALLRRAGELGGPPLLDRVDPYLADPDPVVAELAAGIATEWSGVGHTATPTGLPSAPLPSFAELAALEDSVAVVTMAGGDRFVIATLPFEAPTNAARFMRMARDGDFDGLTWHRVVPNFVVQGGSPHANEYAGHGVYTRDEIGLVGHFAGTLGVSTRGRDTADGQPFFNLVDNLRLDHDYTVFGYVVDGFDAVRRVRAGDVIRSVEIRPR